MAIGLGAIGLALISGDQGGSGGGTLVTGALYAAAALRGNDAVNRCRASFDQYDHEVNAGPIAEDAPKPKLPTPRLVAPPVRPPAPAAPVEAAAEPETNEAEPAPPPAPRVTDRSAGEDAFHTTVGQEPPVRAARQVATPAPAMSPWREFWREVP